MPKKNKLSTSVAMYTRHKPKYTKHQTETQTQTHQTHQIHQIEKNRKINYKKKRE